MTRLDAFVLLVPVCGLSMSTSPTPSAIRGDITLQPSYFTSSLYVDLLRDDISYLISTFSQRYKRDRPAHPFACFKEVWKEQGWSWLHFKVFDGRARHSFISITERLFIGKFALLLEVSIDHYLKCYRTNVRI